MMVVYLTLFRTLLALITWIVLKRDYYGVDCELDHSLVTCPSIYGKIAPDTDTHVLNSRKFSMVCIARSQAIQVFGNTNLEI